MPKLTLVASALSRPKRGYQENGDTHVFRAEGERFLLALVDGLGHGPRARAVSQAAEEFLHRADLTLDAYALISSLHLALQGTRGAAAMLCVIDQGRISGCGVGNVELRVVGTKLPVQLSPGILGTQVRKFRIFEGTLRAGDRLILFSDGISGRLPLQELAKLDAASLCAHALERYAHDDDATILVADVFDATLV